MKPLLTFDIWGTLMTSNPEFKKIRNEMLRNRFVPNVSQSVFTEALVEADDAVDAMVEETGRDLGFDHRVSAAIYALTGNVPAPTELEVARRIQDETALRHAPILINEDIPGLILDLKDKYRVAVISNTGMLYGPIMRSLLTINGLGIFDHYTFSNEVTYAKPSPVIYDITLTQMETSPKYAIHIGDNPNADIRGAKEAGMDAVLVGKKGVSINEVLESLL